MARKTILLAALGALTAAVVALVVGTAVGAAPAPTVAASQNATLKQTITVDRHGRSLYRLSGESAHHLLCRSSACVAIWPPLTVASRHIRLRAGHGVHGRLGLVRRPDGKLQVTLRGLPLYRFSGDARRGDVNGQGIKSFGGTWGAVPAAPAAASMPAPQPAPSPAPYSGYPGY